MQFAAVLVIAIAIMHMTLPAAAEPVPVDEVFGQFGLFGNWALDCDKAAMPANPHLRIASPSAGAVEEIHDLGEGFATNRYRVLSARRISDERLQVAVMFQTGTGVKQSQTLVLLVSGRTRRTLFNQPDGAAVRVKDGIVVANSTKTPVLRKCD